MHELQSIWTRVTYCCDNEIRKLLIKQNEFNYTILRVYRRDIPTKPYEKIKGNCKTYRKVVPTTKWGEI